MYTIIDRKLLDKDCNQNSMYLMKIVCDTASDLPTPENDWAPGSEAKVLADGGSKYELSNTHEWTAVNFSTGEGGGDSAVDAYTKTEVNNLLLDKVDKANGMGLSQNSFTDEDKSKLDDTYTKSEVNDLVNVKANVENVYTKTETDNLVNVKANANDVYTKTETDNLVNVKANANDVYTKTETDSAITTKVSALVAGAPERFDTLKELADWIDSHADSAAAMNSAIEKNAEDVATANTAIEKNAEDLATANTNIQANVDDITATKNDVAINKTTLGTQCKNLLKNTAVSKSEHNANFTVNEDGTITVSTTAVTNNTATLTINSNMTLAPGTYKLTGSSELGEKGQLRLYIGSEFKRAGDTFTINEPTKITNIRLFVYTGVELTEKTVYPMLRYADITDNTYEPYQADVNTRVSALETLSDAVYKYHKSSYCTIDGYVLRVGNQVHLNLTATFHTACGEWYGGIINLPFNTKTPDNSTRYTIKQTQSDGRETSIYLQMGGTSFYSSTTFKKGDIITIPPMILNMYVEEEATTTEGGE